MRFKEFILSEVFQDTKYFEESLSVIAKECRPFLDASDKLPLFRGMSQKAANSVQYSFHPEKRTARDSSPEFNLFFNAGIELAFGISDIRKKSVFCTGDLDIAKEYGSAYYIFPKGKFKFIWSENVSDSWDFTIGPGFIDEMRREGIQPRSSEGLKFDKVQTEISELLNADEKSLLKADEKTKDAINKIFSDNDFINSNSEKSTFYDGLIEALKNTYLGLYDADMFKDLQSAILSQHEILMYESDGYYSISIKDAIEYAKTQDDIMPGGYTASGVYRYLCTRFFK